MLPTKSTVLLKMQSLQSIADKLIPQDEVIQSLLQDALEGKLNGGLHGYIQKQLLALHQAKTEIQKAVSTLDQYKD